MDERILIIAIHKHCKNKNMYYIYTVKILYCENVKRVILI